MPKPHLTDNNYFYQVTLFTVAIVVIKGQHVPQLHLFGTKFGILGYECKDTAG